MTTIIDTAGGKVSLVTAIAFTFVAALTIGLRLLAKRYTKTKWAMDDSWAICSLVGMFAWVGVEFWGLYKGVQDTKSRTYLKTTYAAGTLYSFTSITTKLSILYLYRRLFPVEPFRRITATMAAIWATLGFTMIVLCLVPCRPVKKFWEPDTPGSCYEAAKLTLGFSSLDIIMDAVTLLLPVKVISGLHMSSRKRCILYFIFLLGGFVVITGIVRLVLLLKDHYIAPNGHMFTHSQGQIWSNVHIGTAILCASLPTFRPLLSHFLTFCNDTASRVSSLFLASRTVQETGSQRCQNDDDRNIYHQVNSSAGDKRFFMKAATIESGSWSVESRAETDRINAQETADAE